MFIVALSRRYVCERLMATVRSSRFNCTLPPDIESDTTFTEAVRSLKSLLFVTPVPARPRVLLVADDTMARALVATFESVASRLALVIVPIESIIDSVARMTRDIDFPVSYHYFPGHVTLAYLFAYTYVPDECIIVLGTDQYWLRSPHELIAYMHAHALATTLIATPIILRSVDDSATGPLRYMPVPGSDDDNVTLSRRRGDFLVSGTTVLNLTRMRAADTQRLYTQAVAWAKRGVKHTFFYQDQDFLNVLALFRPDAVLALPVSWNLMRCAQFASGAAFPAVVHYNCGRRHVPSRFDAYIQFLDSMAVNDFRSSLEVSGMQRISPTT